MILDLSETNWAPGKQSAQKTIEPAIEPKPFLKNNELIIPSDCAQKYRWWQGGQSIFETLQELEAPVDLMEQHIGEIGSPREHWQEVMRRRQQ